MAGKDRSESTGLPVLIKENRTLHWIVGVGLKLRR